MRTDQEVSEAAHALVKAIDHYIEAKLEALKGGYPVGTASDATIDLERAIVTAITADKVVRW